MKEQRQDKEFMKKSTLRRWTDENKRKASEEMSKISKERWEDPGFRDKWSASIGEIKAKERKHQKKQKNNSQIKNKGISNQ